MVNRVSTVRFLIITAEEITVATPENRKEGKEKKTKASTGENQSQYQEATLLKMHPQLHNPCAAHSPHSILRTDRCREEALGRLRAS